MPSWHAHPDVWLLVVVLGGGYTYALKRIGPSKVHPIERAATRRQIAAFCTGLFVLWLGADYPIHDVAESRLYFVHMIQHMLFTLVAPPLLMIGTPDWLWRTVLGRRGIAVLRQVSRPLIALVIFNTAIVVTHIPDLVTLSSRSEVFHFAAHTMLFTAAVVMWTPVVNPLIELPKLSYPARMFYLFLQSLVPTVPASFLTFGHGVLYHVYEDFPRMFGIDVMTDQRAAGLIMKIAGGFILWGVIAFYFFKWFALEERENVDVLEWNKIDRELAKR